MAKQNGFIIGFDIVRGTLIGLIFGILDMAFFEITKDLSNIEELFLLSFGDLNLSLFSYNLIFYVSLGAVIGLLGHFILGINHWPISKLKKVSQIQFNSMIFVVFEIIIRFHSYKRLLVFFVVMAGLFLIIYRKLNKSGIRLRYKNKSALPIMIVCLWGCLLISILLPDLYFIFLKSRFHTVEKDLKTPNILMIMMDTVRADHLSCYNYSKKTTPHIDNISKEGALFLKAISPAPWTLPAHASIFTGLYPIQHEAGWKHMQLDKKFMTLAEYLRGNGYKTVSLWENPWVSGMDSGLAKGFDEFYPLYSYPYKSVGLRAMNEVRKRVFNYKDPKEFTKDTVNDFKIWILKNGRSEKPFFAFINFIIAHAPNYPRKGFTTVTWTPADLLKIEKINVRAVRFYLPQYKLNQRELDIMKDIYDGELSYLDSKIGELYDFLKAANLLNNTILILTSDHGENFGDHGLIEHGFSLYHSVLHVPLIIRYPDKIEAGQIIQERVSNVYLFGTIIELIGDRYKKHSLSIERRSLFEKNGEKNVYAEHDNCGGALRGEIEKEAPDFNFKPFEKEMKCIYEGNYKFVWSSDGQHELYNTVRDWNEKENLIQKETEKARDLKNKLTTWENSLWKPGSSKEIPKIDETAKKALKSLGYIK